MDANLPPDWREFFAALLAHDVRFVVIGALAVAAHAEPRFSEDLDVFVEASASNARKLRAALVAFGFGDAVPKVTELAKAGPIWMLGRKPLRIDILTEISGVSWKQAWAGRVAVAIDGMQLPVLGREQLIANKAAAGRPKDLRDLAVLESLRTPRPKRRKR
jgi:predicted nucleotidyltransferase